MRERAGLRGFIELLGHLDDVRDIPVRPASDLELSAIIRRCCELGAPAPLFTGFSAGRILGAPVALSDRAGHPLLRAALSLGLMPQCTGRLMVEMLAASLARPPLPPITLTHAPCLDTHVTEGALGLDRLPLPRRADGNEAPVAGTWGCIAVRSLGGNTHWANVPLSRSGDRLLCGTLASGEPLGVIAREWLGAGRSMPFALALGVEPIVPFFCAPAHPHLTDPAGRVGAFLGRSLPMLRCPTVPLDVPASAEILIEGHVLSIERARDRFTVHGPGNSAEQSEWLMACQVDAVSHRDDPILPLTVIGEPVDDHHVVGCLATAAASLHALRTAGMPVTTVWGPLAAGGRWLIVTVPRGWSRLSGIDEGSQFAGKIADVIFRARAEGSASGIVVLNDDVDPADARELLWAVTTRCHPIGSRMMVGREPVSVQAIPPDHNLRQAEKIVFNGLPPEEWGEMLPFRASFKEGYPEWVTDRVLERWQQYGFAEPDR